MGDNHDHNDEYPGPNTHQAPWVMWMTLFACISFLATVLGVRYFV